MNEERVRAFLSELTREEKLLLLAFFQCIQDDPQNPDAVDSQEE